VFSDYKRFVSTVHKSLPKAKIVFIAIKPSIRRKSMLMTVSGANNLIREYTLTDDRLEFADIATPMLGDLDVPPADLFVEDGLHLSPKGEEMWRKVLRPYLD
jgi:lysophospholipase L1-like esterase